MQDRLESEIDLLQQQYPSIEHGGNFDWVLVEGVELDEEWNRDTTDVLLQLPSGYPETPPRNFWVPAGLKCNGQQPGSFATNHKRHDGQHWDRFSWRVQNNWKPTEDVKDGSNLVTFMNSVEARLEEGV